MANEFSDKLAVVRNRLNDVVLQGPEHVVKHWAMVEEMIQSWWAVYQKWEEKDNFSDAFAEDRMSVRTFDAGFEKQVSKEFGPGTIKVVSQVKNKDGDGVHEELRMFGADKFTPLAGTAAKTHDRNFHLSAEKDKYHAQRGIDSSSFAVAENFKTRDAKYFAGLHDLSASLMNHSVSIFDQIHNNEQGAHFSFLPLSEEADQELLFNLTRCAKGVKTLSLYQKVRDLRANISRVKLAGEFDMAVGYSAAPMQDWQTRLKAAPATGKGLGRSYKPGAPVPAYRLRYGMGLLTTIVGEGGQQTVKVTPEIYAARQEAARHFKSILGVRHIEAGQKNEIVLAIRKHRGPFPVYATREGQVLKCYTIGADSKGVKTMDLNNKTISSSGVMTG